MGVYPHKILFIRHGETDHNAQGRLQGQRDVPLNPQGPRAGERGRAFAPKTEGVADNAP